MKIFVILFAFIANIISISVQAQFKQISEGPEFEEPVDGYAKILQLKNGSTFYLHVTMKDGVNVRIYDSSHNEKKTTSFQTSYGELSEKMRDKVLAAFEINNEVIVFVYHTNEKIPTLYRLIIDGATGKLKQQKTISVIKKEWRVSTFNAAYVADFFIIKKDPTNDNYAVITDHYWEHFREKEPSKQIHIVHYNGDHTEISNEWLPATTETGEKIVFKDLLVKGPEKLLAIVSGLQDKVQNFYLVDIKKGAVALNKINIEPGGIYNGFYAFKFNPVSKKLLFLSTAVPAEAKLNEYAIDMFMIDAETKEVQSVNNIGLSQKSQDFYKDQFNEKKGFRGMPQNIVISANGGFTILYEDNLIIPNGMGVETSLEALAAVSFDKDGNKTSDYVIPKSHRISHKSFYPMYLYREELAAIELFESNQYKSFVYLDAGTKKFILFNDSEKNNNIDRHKFNGRATGVGLKGVTAIISMNSDIDAFMYQLSGDNPIPERNYLFEEKNKIRAMALLKAAVYDPVKNIYITLRFDKKTGKGIMARMVWLEVN